MTGKVDLGDRRTYLGGSTIAAILGLSSYQAPIDVWRFMKGLDEPQEQTDRMWLGNQLEQIVADAYERETGRRVQRNPGGSYRHPHYPFIVGHPDRIVIGEPGIFEAKAAMSRAGYGDPGTDQVPPGHRVQVEVYMGLSRRSWADIVLLRGTAGIEIYHVEHDRQLYDQIVESAAEWWNRHIVRGEEPEPDGTDAYRRHLAEKFPRVTEMEMVATAEQVLVLEEFFAAMAQHKAAEARVKELKNRVAKVMGETGVLLSPVGKVTRRAVHKDAYMVKEQDYIEVRGWPAKEEEAAA